MTILSKTEQTAIREVLGRALFGKLLAQVGEARLRYALEALEAAGPTGPDKSRREYFIACARGRTFADNESARAHGINPTGKTGDEVRAEVQERYQGDGNWLLGGRR